MKEEVIKGAIEGALLCGFVFVLSIPFDIAITWKMASFLIVLHYLAKLAGWITK